MVGCQAQGNDGDGLAAGDFEGTEAGCRRKTCRQVKIRRDIAQLVDELREVRADTQAAVTGGDYLSVPVAQRVRAAEELPRWAIAKPV